MVFIIFYRTSYPEDHENFTYIQYVFDEKKEAFDKLINLAKEHKSSYSDYFIIEAEEDTFINKTKKYRCNKNFIISDGEVVYHQNIPELIEKNNNLFQKIKETNLLIDEYNKECLEKYNSDLILYREGKIKHPILKKYSDYSLNTGPKEEEELKKFDNYVDSIKEYIIKKKNDLIVINQ